MIIIYIIDKIISPFFTFVINIIYKKIGKVYFEFDNWSCKMGKYNDCGDYETVNDVKDAENGGIINFKVNICNRYQYPISLKNFRISFTTRVNIYDYKLNVSDILNLEPKKMIDLKLECNLTKEDLINIDGFKKVYFKAYNYKNKEIKKLIKDCRS